MPAGLADVVDVMTGTCNALTIDSETDRLLAGFGDEVGPERVGRERDVSRDVQH